MDRKIIHAVRTSPAIRRAVDAAEGDASLPQRLGSR